MSPAVLLTLLDRARDVMFAVATPGFRLIWANQPALDYLRAVRGHAAPIGKFTRELALDHAHADIFESLFLRAMAEGAFETDYVTPLDNRVWHLRVIPVVERGVCTAVVVDARDSTDLSHTALRLAESEGMYRALFDSMAEGAVFQGMDGRIIAANRAAEAIEGRTEAQMKGLTSDASDWDAVKEDGRPFPGDEHPAMVTLRTGQPQSNIIMGIRRPTGERRWISINSRLVQVEGDTAPRAVVATFHDITAQRELESSLNRTNQLLSKLAERVPGALYQFLLTPQGQARIPYASAHAWSLMEVMPDEVTENAQAFFDRVHPDDLPPLMASIQQSAQTMTMWRHEFRVVLPSNGRVVWVGGEADPEQLDDGSVVWHGITRDISDVRAHQAHLFRLAHFDDLTGLPNRRHLLENLEGQLKRAESLGLYGALIQLDLDDFNFVNDAYGHVTGDAIIGIVASRLKTLERPGRTVVRLGGDEFAIVMDAECKSESEMVTEALSYALEVKKLVKQPLVHEHVSYSARCSVGVALFPRSQDSVFDLLREADTALYQAKRSGRNKVQVFEEQMFLETRDRLVLSQQLVGALEQGQISVCVQSQFDTQKREVGAELLLRWSHPERGQVSPEVFIPLAEQVGVIHELGEFVLRQACSALSRLAARSPIGSLSVNVSPVEFMAADYADRVESILLETGTDPQKLILEITESLLIHDAQDVRIKMERLRRFGVRFSIDDFGTGYSSLAYLKSLPIDEVKIDQSFVRDVPGDGNDVAIIQAVLSMARHFGLRVVAEGVETEEQMVFLTHNGCDQLQGYLLARPVAMAQWLAAR